MLIFFQFEKCEISFFAVVTPDAVEKLVQSLRDSTIDNSPIDNIGKSQIGTNLIQSEQWDVFTSIDKCYIL